MRGFKKSPLETRDRNFRDKRSFVSLGGHLVLYGEDKSNQRQAVYGKAHGKCEVCGKDAPLEGESGLHGEWHHIETEVGKHCDCLHNSSWRCGHYVRDCHSKEHAKRAPRFGEAKKGALAEGN